MKKLAGLIVVLGAMMALLAGPAAANTTVTICHAAGLAGTTQYVTLTLPWVAVYGEAGHFNENGTPRAGHEQDYLGPCNEDPPPPPPELVEVCDPATGDIIVVPEDEADQYLPVDDPACQDTPPPPVRVMVCDEATGKLILVPIEDRGKYLPPNSPECKDHPTPPPCKSDCTPPEPPPPAKCDEAAHVSGDQNKACDSLPFTGAHWYEQKGFEVGALGAFGLAALLSGLFLRRRGQL